MNRVGMLLSPTALSGEVSLRSYPARSLIIDGAGHAQAGEKDPVRYFDAIDRLLERYM